MKSKRYLVLLLWLVCLMMSGFEKVQAEKPPLRSGRIIGEILAGEAGGFVGGYGGFFIVGSIPQIPQSRVGEWALRGSYIGWTLGSAGGVYTAGNRAGSFPATVVGSLLGSAVGFRIAASSAGNLNQFLEDFPFGDIPRLFWGSWFAPIGATIAFNLTRKHKSHGASASPAAPPIYFNLVRVRF